MHGELSSMISHARARLTSLPVRSPSTLQLSSTHGANGIETWCIFATPLLQPSPNPCRYTDTLTIKNDIRARVPIRLDTEEAFLQIAILSAVWVLGEP